MAASATRLARRPISCAGVFSFREYFTPTNCFTWPSSWARFSTGCSSGGLPRLAECLLALRRLFRGPDLLTQRGADIPVCQSQGRQECLPHHNKLPRLL